MKLEEELKTIESKKQFIKGILYISKADGEIDSSEKKFFEQSALALGLNNDDILKLENDFNSVDKITVKFDTSRETMFFLIQAIQLCYIDGKYTDDEKNAIRSIASLNNISEKAIRSVEEWVEEGMKWNIRGDALLTLR